MDGDRQWHDGTWDGIRYFEIAVLWRANIVLGTREPRGDEGWIYQVAVAVLWQEGFIEERR
jgi:hypothetical protein